MSATCCLGSCIKSLGRSLKTSGACPYSKYSRKKPSTRGFANFSPIAAEPSSEPNRPPAAPLNANLKKYTAAMAEVAKANNVPFIDLFAPSEQLFAAAAKAKQTLTFNTVHLTEAGDKALAPEAFRALFGETAPDVAKLGKLVEEL